MPLARWMYRGHLSVAVPQHAVLLMSRRLNEPIGEKKSVPSLGIRSAPQAGRGRGNAGTMRIRVCAERTDRKSSLFARIERLRGGRPALGGRSARLLEKQGQNQRNPNDRNPK